MFGIRGLYFAARCGYFVKAVHVPRVYKYDSKLTAKVSPRCVHGPCRVGILPITRRSGIPKQTLMPKSRLCGSGLTVYGSVDSLLFKAVLFNQHVLSKVRLLAHYVCIHYLFICLFIYLIYKLYTHTGTYRYIDTYVYRHCIGIHASLSPSIYIYIYVYTYIYMYVCIFVG